MIDCRQFQTWLDETGFAKVIELRESDISANDASVRTPHESDPMLEHLAACTTCSHNWHDAQETWLTMANALDPLPVDSGLESTIMRRVLDASSSDMTSASSSTTSLVREHESRIRFFAKAEFWRYVVAASVLAALVAFVMFRPTASQLSGSRPTAEELATIEEFARQMDRLDKLQHVFGSPELHFVSFESTDATQRVQGYIVYDLVSGEGHFFGFDLRLPGDQYYKISLLNESGKTVSSAAIDIESGKKLGTAVIKLPPDVGSLKEAIVTIEDRIDEAVEGVDDSHSDRIVMRTKVAL